MADVPHEIADAYWEAHDTGGIVPDEVRNPYESRGRRWARYHCGVFGALPAWASKREDRCECWECVVRRSLREMECDWDERAYGRK